MDNPQSTFNNDTITVRVSHKPSCRVVLEVTVTPEAAQAGYKKAIAVVKKEVSIPGFRKGKAPESVIVDNYSKQIHKEWNDIVMNTALTDAVQLTRLVPFNKSVNSANMKSISKENGAVVTFEYEATPNVPSVSPKELSIPQVDVKAVTNEAVQDLIEGLQLQNATWTAIADRPAQEGDFIVVDIDDISGTPRSICKNTLLRLKNGRLDSWIYNLAIGRQTGDAIEGMSEAPKHEENCSGCADGTHEKHADFIPTLCRISLHEIKQAILHPLDEELAKKHGASDVNDLQEKAKKALENQAAQDQRETQRLLIEKAILEKYPFEIPASLIEGELAGIEAAITQKLKAENVPASEIGAEARRIKEQLKHKYERDFLLYFITQKAAREHHVTVSKEEVMMELMRRMFAEQQQGRANQDSFKDMKEKEAQLEMQILATKVLDFLVEQATL